ncbi:MAG: rod shape-determining protein MreC [Gammaproteobacteria bacterium]|nr:MAG: rod shape-determining protein MreC [Gammaproteobacteria bacterium]TND06323.1 MAG: rod shape-determining protein MreC [Gammaproteobacteria bacterium]
MLAATSLIILDYRQNHLESVRDALSVVAYPLQLIVNLPRTVGTWVDESLTTRQTLQADNTGLRAQNLLLNVRLQKLATLESENMRLRELLDSSFKINERVLIAELLAVDLDPFTRRIVINKGSRNGVIEGQTVVDAHGVIGQTIHVGPLSSIAMLITDPSHALPIQINRNGLRAVLVGTGETDRLELMHVPNTADIKVGDLLVTSGLGGRFPPGYPVARVTAFLPDPRERFAQVAAEPMASIEQSREVLLVWSSAETAAGDAPCAPDDTSCNTAPEGSATPPAGTTPTPGSP